MDNIIIFGASTLGEIAYHYLRENDTYNIIGFTDNNRSKLYKKFCGLDVISPDSLKKDDYNIVVASFYNVEIVKQLLLMGIKKFYVFEESYESYILNHYNYSYVEDFSIRENKIAFIMENPSGSNTFALMKYIERNHLYDYEIVLLKNYKKDKNYFYDLLTSNVVIHTHASTFLEDQINIQLWHGFPLKALSYMSATESLNKKLNNLYWSNLDYIFSYSQTYSTLINASYGVDGDKYVVTGMPRNDFLFTSDGKSNLSSIINQDITNKKIIFYMPTFRETNLGYSDGSGEDFGLFNLIDFDKKCFDQFLAAENIIMILKTHPMQTKGIKRYLKNLNADNIYLLDDDILIENRMDLYELINGVDILLTDYSSIYFDYLLLDRPIIFIPYDLESYRKNRGFLVEPYNFWAPGPKCATLKDLKFEIQKCLRKSNYYRKERKMVNDIVHYYKDGESSKRVWSIIDSLMREDKT